MQYGYASGLTLAPVSYTAGPMTDDLRPLRDTRRGDRWAAVAYLLAALWVTKGLWADPAGVMLTENRQDHVQFEWVLTNAARTVAHLSDPFFTDLMNHPAGVNLMANTSIWGLALPLAPVTALFGAPVAFCVLLTGAYFGTAFAWYFVLSRYVLGSRVAAFVGGALAAFLPGMIGQGTGHPNIVAQFAVPFIVAVVLRMREPGHAVRNGLLLAAAVTYQIFVNEEVLLLTALALGIFTIAYWVQRPAVVRRALPAALGSLAVTTAVVSAVIAYPLYRQFLGAQAYHGLPDWVLEYNTDVVSYVSYAEQSLAGTKAGAEKLAQGVAEQNTFYGWGLLALVVFTVVWLRRDAAVRALAVVGMTFGLLSLGRTLTVGGEKTQITGPWAVLSKLPLLDTVVPTRLSLVTIPVVALLVAFFLDRVAAGSRQVRLVGAAALAAALLPVVPMPLAVQDRRPTPVFFASGHWRDHVPAGATIGLLPFAWDSSLDMMQYQTTQHLDFAILNGYFLGPDPGSPDRRAAFGAGWAVARDVLGDQRPSRFTVSADDRADTLRDLRAWGADALVLPDGAPREEVVRDAADQILGPGQHVDDVTIWKLR
jgi:hypothetical protein